MDGPGGPAVTHRPTRVAVIGDVGGHLGPLRDELVRLGADPRTGRLPPDLVVIQVGDLIHRGPDSAGAVALADRYLTEQPSHWIQLVGNHEAQYLREPAFDWPEHLPDTAIATLQRWWADGTMVVAAAYASKGSDFLVTHAGLTAGYWRSVLDAPARARDVARALNALPGRREGVVFRPGAMLGSGKVNHAAGPLWAEAGRELVPSWDRTRLPFSQIHGHSTIRTWHDGSWRATQDVVAVTTVDEAARHETSTLTGGIIVGVDPCHGTESTDSWRAWVAPLDGRVHT